jgi:hypothetical protein
MSLIAKMGMMCFLLCVRRRRRAVEMENMLDGRTVHANDDEGFLLQEEKSKKGGEEE